MHPRQAIRSILHLAAWQRPLASYALFSRLSAANSLTSATTLHGSRNILKSVKTGGVAHLFQGCLQRKGSRNTECRDPHRAHADIFCWLAHMQLFSKFLPSDFEYCLFFLVQIFWMHGPDGDNMWNMRLLRGLWHASTRIILRPVDLHGQIVSYGH
jgi:hypothetical protein